MTEAIQAITNNSPTLLKPSSVEQRLSIESQLHVYKGIIKQVQLLEISAHEVDQDVQILTTEFERRRRELQLRAESIRIKRTELQKEHQAVDARLKELTSVILRDHGITEDKFRSYRLSVEESGMFNGLVQTSENVQNG